jgi:DNA-directed RNA polymerase specialized sigma24 family protein
MSSRDKARLVRMIGKQEETLERLDDRIREALSGLDKAQKTVLRLQQVRDRTQDKLDDAMEMYDSLGVEDNG